MTFEEFTANILKKAAKGRVVKWDEELKAFGIEVNSWFYRTIYYNDLLDAWRDQA